MNIDRNKNILNFILSERFITLTVIGSVFTFGFISALKSDVIDPLLYFMLPEENFNFMDVTLRDGEAFPVPRPKRLELKIGDFLREFISWIFSISILFLISKYTRFPDNLNGNPGVAIM